MVLVIECRGAGQQHCVAAGHAGAAADSLHSADFVRHAAAVAHACRWPLLL